MGHRSRRHRRGRQSHHRWQHHHPHPELVQHQKGFLRLSVVLGADPECHQREREQLECEVEGQVAEAAASAAASAAGSEAAEAPVEAQAALELAEPDLEEADLEEEEVVLDLAAIVAVEVLEGPEVVEDLGLVELVERPDLGSGSSQGFR